MNAEMGNMKDREEACVTEPDKETIRAGEIKINLAETASEETGRVKAGGVAPGGEASGRGAPGGEAPGRGAPEGEASGRVAPGGAAPDRVAPGGEKNGGKESGRELPGRMLPMLLAVYGISGMCAQPLGSFIPFLRNAYGFDYRTSGMFLSAQSLGNLISSLLAGFLPLYLGRRRGILSTAVWMGVCWFLIASGIGNPAVIMIGCFMNGIARGGNANFVNTTVSTFPVKKTPRAYNLLHGIFSFGALVTPLLLILCTQLWNGSGWRIMAGILCVLIAVQLVLFSGMPMPPETAARNVKTVDRSFLKSRLFWLTALMLFSYIAMEYSVIGWLVTYFQDLGILAANESQIMNSLFLLTMFVGRMTGAVVTARISREQLLAIDGIGCFAFFLLMLLGSTRPVIIAGIIGTAFFMAPVYPTAFAFGSGEIHGNDIGAGLLTFIGSSGGILTPMLIGFVAQAHGIKAGMTLVAGFTVLLLAVILVSVHEKRKVDKLRAQT